MAVYVQSICKILKKTVMADYIGNIQSNVQKQCSHCSNTWWENHQSSGWASSSKTAAHNSALKEHAKEIISTKVLCPKCKHFALLTMQRYFPTGFEPGLRRLYQKQTWMALASALMYTVCGAIALGLGIFFWNLDISSQAWFWRAGRILVLIIFWGWFFVSSITVPILIWKFISQLFQYPFWITQLKYLTEDQMLAMAVRFYEFNDETLRINITAPVGLRSPWRINSEILQAEQFLQTQCDLSEIVNGSYISPPKSTGDKKWSYKTDDGIICGPLSAREIKMLVKALTIKPETLLQTSDKPDNWYPASRIKGLFNPKVKNG